MAYICSLGNLVLLPRMAGRNSSLLSLMLKHLTTWSAAPRTDPFWRHQEKILQILGVDIPYLDVRFQWSQTHFKFFSFTGDAGDSLNILWDIHGILSQQKNRGNTYFLLICSLAPPSHHGKCCCKPCKKAGWPRRSTGCFVGFLAKIHLTGVQTTDLCRFSWSLWIQMNTSSLSVRYFPHNPNCQSGDRPT